uniref:flavin reductase family protein n=1 Tax=Pararhizobium sp. IMCC3301 TaxID=3067904 RepID=UPI0027426134|nr:flavin reductase family protein [Pararhizobium sp. IMCC3301]
MTVSTQIRSSQSDSVSKDQFRDAMSRVGSAVHIVTSGGIAGQAGLTVTAFSAVSDAPPIVLVCVNRASRSNEIIKKNGIFCVNILSAGERHMADLFAGRNVAHPEANRFEGLQISKTVSGAPVLPGCLASMDCALERIVEMGTHSVLFGHVQAIVPGQLGPGLIYRDRDYHAL